VGISELLSFLELLKAYPEELLGFIALGCAPFIVIIWFMNTHINRLTDILDQRNNENKHLHEQLEWILTTTMKDLRILNKINSGQKPTSYDV
jgi:hypothetical protein